MQLVLICKGLITGIRGAGAASLLRTRRGKSACWDHYRLHEEIRTQCKRKLFFFLGGGDGVWQAAQVCIQFCEHIWFIYISKFGPQGSTENCGKGKIKRCINSLPLTHQRSPVHLLAIMKLNQNPETNRTVYFVKDHHSPYPLCRRQPSIDGMVCTAWSSAKV